MKAYLHRCFPGECHSCELRRGSTLVAVEGGLSVAYEHGLDWLPEYPSRRAVMLDEGACLVLPCRAFVDVRAAGAGAATVWIAPSQIGSSWAAALLRLAQWLRRARLSGIASKLPRADRAHR